MPAAGPHRRKFWMLDSGCQALADGNMENSAGGDARPWSFAALRLAVLLCAAFVITSLLKRSTETRKVQGGGGEKLLKFWADVPIRV